MDQKRGIDTKIYIFGISFLREEVKLLTNLNKKILIYGTGLDDLKFFII